MRFTFTVNIEIEHSTGKFATRDEIEEQVTQALTDADQGEWTGDSGGEYQTVDWEVTT